MIHFIHYPSVNTEINIENGQTAEHQIQSYNINYFCRESGAMTNASAII